MALISRVVPNRWLRLLLAAVLLAVAGYLLWQQGTAYSELRAARADLDRYKFPAAEEHLSRCLAIWPTRADVWLLAGQAARRREDYARAEECYTQVHKLNDGQPTDELNFERVLMQAQLDPDDKLEYLRPLVEAHDPRSNLILEAMVRGYMRRHRFLDAGFLANVWLERKPDDPYALLCRGAVRDQLGPRVQCVEDFQRVLEIDPDQEEARMRLTRSLLDLARPAEALRTIGPLVEKYPNEPKVLIALAECQDAVGEQARAEATARMVLSLQPDHEEALVLLGKLLVDRDQLDEAERHLRRALKLRPSLYQARHQLHRVLVSTKRDQEAEEVKASLASSSKDTVRLAALFTDELPKAPRNPAHYLEVGQIFLRASEPAVAVHWLSDGLRHAGPYPVVQRQMHAELAAAYARLGDRGRAEAHARLADPDPLRGKE
jgi:tetratricopeptide (TPR) repeat protein